MGQFADKGTLSILLTHGQGKAQLDRVAQCTTDTRACLHAADQTCTYIWHMLLE
jgi:hypothetical protein